MNYKLLKLFRPVPNLFVSPDGNGTKHLAIGILSENSDIVKCLEHMNINKNVMRYIFTPTTASSILPSMFNNPLRPLLMKIGMRPVRGLFKNIDQIENKNYFIDLTSFIDRYNAKYKVKRYNSSKVYNAYNSVINNLKFIPEDKFEKVLLYSVNMSQEFSHDIYKRKIFPVFFLLFKAFKNKNSEIPFDKLILHKYDDDGNCSFTVLYDKNEKMRLARIKSFILNIKEEFETEEEPDNAISLNIVDTKDVEEEKNNNIVSKKFFNRFNIK